MDGCMYVCMFEDTEVNRAVSGLIFAFAPAGS